MKNIFWRRHQSDLLTICTEIKAGAPIKTVLASVTPGGGKSALPVILAGQLIPDYADHICWIVPRQSLQNQGERAFIDPLFRGALNHRHEIRISTNDVNPSRELAGHVTTYQAVNLGWDILRQEFDRKDYILFLDEPHHIRQGGQWEHGISQLISRAKLVVFASGTLDRGDGKPIAFFPYKEVEGGIFPDLRPTGEVKIIQYSRRNALREQAIVPLDFQILDGRTEYLDSDGNSQYIKSLTEASDPRKALFSALNTRYALDLLEQCVEAWWDHKQYVFPPSKLLVVAPSIYRAKKLTSYLNERGMRSLIATSDDSPEALTNIKLFKESGTKSHIDILVTVGMAYEGLDVPQITHIACLTNIRSKPWLEQCFARANRKYDGKISGVIYGPDDPLFVEIVEYIKAEQLAVIQELMPTKPGPEERAAPQPIIPLEGEVTRQRAMDLAGDELDYSQTDIILTALERHAIRGVSPLQFKKAMADVGMAIKISENGHEMDLSSPLLTASERETKLRKALERHVRRYEAIKKIEFGTLNYVIKASWQKGRADMTLSELSDVWTFLHKEYPLT